MIDERGILTMKNIKFKHRLLENVKKGKMIILCEIMRANLTSLLNNWQMKYGHGEADKVQRCSKVIF